MSSGQIIFLVILAALLGGGFYGYHVIRTKIESFSRAAFGTKSLVEGLEQQADDSRNTKICFRNDADF